MSSTEENKKPSGDYQMVFCVFAVFIIRAKVFECCHIDHLHNMECMFFLAIF